MNKKLVSIIIPTFNCSKYIEDTIKSVLNQTYDNFEVLVIDDGSTDDTQKKLEKYILNNEIIYIKKDNGGVASARNVGLKKSKGDLIAFLDSDDIWLPEKLEKQVFIHNNTNEPTLSFTNRYLLKDGKLSDPKDKVFSGFVYKELLRQNFCCISASLFDRSIYNDIGPQMENKFFGLVADYEYWLRISRKYKIYYMGDFLVEYRISENQMTSGNNKNKNKFKVSLLLLLELKKNIFSKYFILNLFYFIKMFLYELRK